jgi:hypothetical protein
MGTDGPSALGESGDLAEISKAAPQKLAKAVKSNSVDLVF